MDVSNVSKLLRELGVKKRGHDLVTNFCGWRPLMEYANRSMRAGWIAAACFTTGGRISEVLNYNPKQFAYDYLPTGEEIIRCDALEVLKKRASASLIKRRRTLMVPAKERMVPILMDAVEYAQNHKQDTLFNFTNRSHAWRIVTEADPAWWPHRFRTERASQLVSEKGFDVALLMKFFNWDKAEEAVGYVRLNPEDMVKRMF